jgi:hypothetical protein
MLEHLVRRSQPGHRGVRMRARRHIPLLPLTLYYAAVVAVGLLLIQFVPGAEHAITAPITPSNAADIFNEAAQPAPAPAPWPGPFGRLALTLFAVLGAVVLALPVAGVYIHTRRLSYDPSLVQTMIVLPIVVAGVVLVVKNSLALAFALAGIVAGVRFRQKLNEPKDAVYVLLSLGLGLAAAVHALDVALAVSLAFNVVVLALWRYDPGTMTAGAGPALAMGDTALLKDAAKVTPAQARAMAEDMDSDGILVVHAPDAEEARRAVEIALAGIAKEFRITEPKPSAGGLTSFAVIMELAKNGDPVDLLAELEERWTTQIAAAEYTPFRHRRPEDDDDDDD